MSATLQGEIALVSGASRGIGAAIADLLAAQGAKVVGTATSESGAAAIGERLAAHGGIDLPDDIGSPWVGVDLDVDLARLVHLFDLLELTVVEAGNRDGNRSDPVADCEAFLRRLSL